MNSKIKELSRLNDLLKMFNLWKVINSREDLKNFRR